MRRQTAKRETRAPSECLLCRQGARGLDYKDVITLRRFLTSRGKILGRSRSGVCAKHQRRLARAIKRARIAALLPFTEKHAL